MRLTLTESLNILGVVPNASREDIKHAYKQKAFECHPDKEGDAAVFRQLTKAKDILLSCKTTVTDGRTGRDIFNGWVSSMLTDLYAETFKKLSKDWELHLATVDHYFYKGVYIHDALNLKTTITVSIEDLKNGKIKLLKYKRFERCSCDISGQSTYTCPVCEGAGKEEFSFSNGKSTISHCDPCNGTGNVTRTCPKCKGSTLVEKEVTLEINLLNVKDGEVLTFKEGGHHSGYIQEDSFGKFDVRIKVV